MVNRSKKSSTIPLNTQDFPNYATLWRFLWIVPLLLMLPTPMAWAKFLLGCAVIILLRFSTPVSKNAVGTGLGILFLFAYLLSPY